MPALSKPGSHLLWAVTLACGLTIAVAAHAQLGSVNNPPPQNLFKFGDTPAPRDDGLGTMAERRRALAQSRSRNRSRSTTRPPSAYNPARPPFPVPGH